MPQIFYSRILANRPMIKINGNVQYLSSGTSMLHAGGKVVRLFENTWMRACGVARLEKDGSRKINKMGNIELLRDVDEERGVFDQAVVGVIRTAIPDFDSAALQAFYQELMDKTDENESMVRRGISSSLGKIAVEDLLLSGALSQDSPFFKETTVGKAIREKGIAQYGIIEICAERNAMDEPAVVEYPEDSDLDFENLTDAHLPNHDLHVIPLNQKNEPVVNTNTTDTPPKPRHSRPYKRASSPLPSSGTCSNLYLRILDGILLASGAAALVVAFAVLNVATLGTASGIILAVCGAVTFFRGGISLASSCCAEPNINSP